MEWNRYHFSTQLYLKGEMISLFEYDLFKGDTDDFFFPVVFVADLEVTFPEFFVPADFIEQILNRNHLANRTSTTLLCSLQLRLPGDQSVSLRHQCADVSRRGSAAPTDHARSCLYELSKPGGHLFRRLTIDGLSID